MAELNRIRGTVQATNMSGRQMSATDLILAVSRLLPEDRTPETVQNHISSFFLNKGETSMNKWQINSIVRQHMGTRLAVNHEDISTLNEIIRRKETGLPGTKV